MLALLLLSCYQPPERKVVVLGLDGLEWSMVDRLIEQGDMPNLAALKERGVWGSVATTTPVMSPIIWTSVASGYPGEVHGIAGWTDGRSHSFNSADARTMRIWDVASKNELPSLVVGWLMSWPASPIAGEMLSDRFVWSRPMNKDPGDRTLSFDREQHSALPGLATPPSLEQRATELLPSDDWLASHPLAYQIEEYGAPFHPLLRDELHVRVFEDRWQDSDARLGMIYLNGPDQVSHLYWSFTDEGILRTLRQDPSTHFTQAHSEMDSVHGRRAVPFSEQVITAPQVDLGARFVPDYYRYIDSVVGRVVDQLDLETTTLLICSDHGFQVSRLTPLIGGGHSREGAVLWVGAGVDPDAQLPEGSVLDLGPTLYALLDLPGAADWPGAPMLEVFPELQPPAPVDSWRLDDRDPAALREVRSGDPQLLEQLEALGYIDGQGKPVLGASRGIQRRDLEH